MVGDGAEEVALSIIAARELGVEGGVAVAGDGGEVLEYLSNTDHAPRLILLGLGMAAKDALKVLRAIRADRWLVPTVLLCSSAERADMIEAYESGANAYVPKPADSAAFTEVVRKITRFWLEVNEPPPKARGWHHRTLSSYANYPENRMSSQGIGQRWL